MVSWHTNNILKVWMIVFFQIIMIYRGLFVSKKETIHLFPPNIVAAEKLDLH